MSANLKNSCKSKKYVLIYSVKIINGGIYMKRIMSLIVAAVVAVLFASCGTQTKGAKLISSSEKLVVIEAEETSGSLKDALDALAESGELSFEGSEGEYGFYITSVNGYTPDASKNEYWAIYTTLGEYEGVSYSSAEFGTYDYNGKTCASASFGASGLLMVEGETYILTVESY